MLNNKWLQYAVAVVAVLGLALSATNYRELRRMEVAAPSAIATIASLMAARDGMIRELQAAPFAEPGHGVLDAYLLRIRRDGVPKHADMKQRLDALADNTTALLTLVDLCAPGARTAAFRSEAPKFRQYAMSWRGRWNSVLELFMAGGNLPATDLVLPEGFRRAVKAEAGG